MKIIYEVGDIVTLEDDIRIPYELANAEVKLIKKYVRQTKWKVKVYESGFHSDLGANVGDIVDMEEKWFTNQVY
jgi:hypothetical protein